MAKHLASYVHVDGKVYGPDDDVPTEVAKAITNPRAWGEEPHPEGDVSADSGAVSEATTDDAPAKKAVAKKVAAKKAAPSKSEK